MGFIDRGNLPQEFFDITGAMLLVQPEPQYLHAQLFKMALSASLDAQLGSIDLPGRMGLGGNGAPYSNLENMQSSFEDPIMAEAIKVVPELGRTPGHTVRVNRPSFADTTYTLASREVPNGSTISTTPIDVSSEQVSITLKRFAGPYDSVNSRVAPFGLDRFDSSVSLHAMAQIVGLHLRRDFDKWLDTVGVTLFNGASTNIIRPTGFSADNDSTIAGDAPMDWNTLTRSHQALYDAKVPTFANGRYACVLHSRQIQQLQEDALFVKYADDHPPINPVLSKSYYKSIDGIDIYRSQTLTSATNASSVSIKYGQMFGPGAVLSGVGRMPSVESSKVDNYGEHALLIWLTYMGFAVADERFLCSIRTS